MTQLLKPGRYVVAVSGGVDSMALLHALAGQPGVRLTVAHFDHGIRPDSAEDRRHVQRFAQEMGLPFVYDRAELGPDASEATARRARYDFLRKVQAQTHADAIVTAHHRDDVLETAFLNILRGTGRRGMTSLASRPGLTRPLLHASKETLRRYAQANGLVWREDSTNQDLRYARNRVRHQVLTQLSPVQKQRLHAHIQRTARLNHEIDALIANHLHVQPSADRFERAYFIRLPHAVALEVLAAWLRREGIAFDSKALYRVTVAAKTFAPDRKVAIGGGALLKIGQKTLALHVPARGAR